MTVFGSPIGAHKVIAVDLAGKSEVMAHAPSFPSCIDFLRDGREFPEMTGSTQRLSQKELDVSRRISMKRAEHLVAESLIKWPGLEAVSLDRRPDGAPRASV